MSGSLLPTAALFTRTSSCPNSSRTYIATYAMDFSSVTSNCTVDRGPFVPAAWISDIATFAFSRDRLAMMT